MLAEHAFVTTLEAPEAVVAATLLLDRCGFKPTADDSSPRLEWTRGPAKPKYRSLDKLPMRLCMEFDRGRVTLAIAIDEPRAEKSVTNYGLAILSALESHVTAASDLESALALVEPAERAVRKRHFRQTLTIWIVVAFFISIFVLIGILAAMSP